MNVGRWLSVVALCALAACSGTETTEEEEPQGPWELTASEGWTCAPTGTNCQDVFNMDLAAGAVLNITVDNVSSGSVSQIALYGPGVALGGTNLLTGTTKELRCNAGSGCANFTGGETKNNVAITQAGVYRLAITREWGSSCGGTGTYRVKVVSTKVLAQLSKTVEDQASLATGFECK